MRLEQPPIRDKVTEINGFFTSIWVLWLNRLTTRVNQGVGVTGTFTTADAKTITVTDGIITDIT